MWTVLALLAGLAGMTPGAAERATPAVDDVERSVIALAERRGRLIYAYDQAAWHGTDDMAAKLPNYRSTIGGYVVDGPADAARLTFYDRDAAEPHALYVARFAGTRLVDGQVLAAREKLEPARKRLADARRIGVAAMESSDTFLCSSSPPNTVVLPPEQPGGAILVYLLTPQTENGAYPFGGHWRIAVDLEGRTSGLRAFTKACVTVPAQTFAKGKPAALYITHLLDAVPTEIHVFTSLSAGLPVIVGTSAGVWEVGGGTIARTTKSFPGQPVSN